MSILKPNNLSSLISWMALNILCSPSILSFISGGIGGAGIGPWKPRPGRGGCGGAPGGGIPSWGAPGGGGKPPGFGPPPVRNIVGVVGPCPGGIPGPGGRPGGGPPTGG